MCVKSVRVKEKGNGAKITLEVIPDLHRGADGTRTRDP